MTGLNNTSQANDAQLGVIHAIRVKADYTVGDGNSVSIGKVPANAAIIDAGIVVTQAFNAGTTNTADIGTSGAVTGLASAIATSVVGRILADEMTTSAVLHPSADQEMFVKLNMTGTAPTTGILYAYVVYALGND